MPLGRYAMIRRTLSTLGIGAALMAFGVAASGAQEKGRPDHGRRDFRRIARALDLSEAQREQAREIQQELRAAAEPLRQRQEALEEQRRAATESRDAQALGEAVLASHDLRDEMRRLHDQFGERFKALLDEGQLRKLEILETMRDLGPPRGRRGRHRGPGDDSRFPPQR